MLHVDRKSTTIKNRVYLKYDKINRNHKHLFRKYYPVHLADLNSSMLHFNKRKSTTILNTLWTYEKL